MGTPGAEAIGLERVVLEPRPAVAQVRCVDEQQGRTASQLLEGESYEPRELVALPIGIGHLLSHVSQACPASLKGPRAIWTTTVCHLR